MAKKYRSSGSNHWLAYIVIAILAATATWQFWPDGDPGDADNPKDDTNANASHSVTLVGKDIRIDSAKTQPGAKSEPEALKKYQDGNAAFAAKEHLKARTLLSEAVFLGGLAEPLAEQARNKLTYLAEVTLFSSTFDPKDPYTMKYKFKDGELPAIVERQQRLHIPTQLMVQVNNLIDAGKFRAGASYKLIKGPFHAVVYKSMYKMDLYLHRGEDKLPPVFIKRYEVGLGKHNSTPVGMWRLGCGALRTPDGKRERGKLYRARWNPPPNSSDRVSIEYNMPGYPFGRKGLWISLVGLDKNTKKLIDYGIHSTDDPSSIGKQASMGCVRMRDNDIQEVYDRLYEKWSKVQIVP